MVPGPFRTVVRWATAGAVVPSALLALWGSVVALAGGTGFTDALGATMLGLLVVAPCGAAAGLLLGVVHVVVRSRRRSPARTAAAGAVVESH